MRWPYPSEETTPARTFTPEEQACRDLLTIIAGLGHCTPEEGYRGNIGWAVSDLKKALKERDCSLLAALRPFAEAAELGSGYMDKKLLVTLSDATVTLGDCRRAKAALQEAEGGLS